MEASVVIDLIKSKISLLQEYRIQEIDFTKNNPNINFCNDGFGISAVSEKVNRGISIIFFSKTNTIASNTFFIRFYQLNKAYPDIYLDKYLENSNNVLSVSNLCLDRYIGSDNEKLEQFINYLNSILNEPFMRDVLNGKSWSDQFHKSIWEGTDR